MDLVLQEAGRGVPCCLLPHNRGQGKGDAISREVRLLSLLLLDPGLMGCLHRLLLPSRQKKGTIARE